MGANFKTAKGQRRKPGKQAGFEVWRDSVRVVGRFDPLKTNGLWYPSWIIQYSLHGHRVRERRNTLRKARACADAAATKLAHGEMEALQLRGEDRRVYLAAVTLLKPLKVKLDAAIREYVDAKRTVKREDLRTVASYFKKHARVKLKPITVSALVEEMLKSLEQDKRGEYHIRDLRTRLSRFAKGFPVEISEVKQPEMETWLRQLKSRAKGTRRDGPLKGRSRNNYRDAIVELFNYAKAHSYLSPDLPTEAEGLKRVPEDDKRDNEIFTPDQMDDLLNHAKPKLVLGMAIKAFSGVRTEEMAFMQWEHIHFRKGKGYIILPKAITKKKRRRILPLLPNLRKWIAPFEGFAGRICENWSTPQSVFQAWDRLAKARGIKAGENRFRNSYISYRVAQTNDPAKVALETGNSAEVIMEDYLELTTPEEAARWFRVSPSAKQEKALLAYAAQLKRSRSSDGVETD